jgi:fructoselysine-6-P-deglycase FrlB-like protein
LPERLHIDLLARGSSDSLGECAREFLAERFSDLAIGRGFELIATRQCVRSRTVVVPARLFVFDAV